MTFYVQCRRISALMYYILTVQFLWAYLSGSCHIIQSIYTKIRGLREFFRAQFSLCAFYSLESQKSREKSLPRFIEWKVVFRGFSRWPTLKFRNFMKILKYSIFGPKASVIPIYVCFQGQETHFWCYFLDLTKITRNEGQKHPFLG